jgi:hypothetical protein
MAQGGAARYAAHAEAEEAPPMSWDRRRWLTTGELLTRGWPRKWFEPLLGQPTKRGPYKLWSRDVALKAEQHPLFQEAQHQLAIMADGARYLTPEQQQALELAIRRFNAGQLPPAEKLEVRPAEPSEWPKSDWTADALTLTWNCGGKVVVPQLFLEAVRKGLGETGPRLALGVATVLSDWRLGRVKPNSLANGRKYFLGWLRNTLIALKELEQPAPRSRISCLPSRGSRHRGCTEPDTGNSRTYLRRWHVRDQRQGGFRALVAAARSGKHKPRPFDQG